MCLKILKTGLVSCIVGTFAFLIYFGMASSLTVDAKETSDVAKDNEVFDSKTKDKKNNPEKGYDMYTQEYLDMYFAGLDADQKILELPRGGFIYAHTALLGVVDASVIAPDGITIDYDVDTNLNAETVAEVKERLLNTPIIED
ncbi:MAG: hypothetical protein ACK5KR_05170 [Breznakia sp.]